MKRSSKTGKLIYQIATVAIVVASFATIIATAGLTWLVYGDFTRDYPFERQVPHINRENVIKATEILRRKESSVKIDLKTREVKFGRSEPFEE